MMLESLPAPPRLAAEHMPISFVPVANSWWFRVLYLDEQIAEVMHRPIPAIGGMEWVVVSEHLDEPVTGREMRFQTFRAAEEFLKNLALIRALDSGHLV